MDEVFGSDNGRRLLRCGILIPLMPLVGRWCWKSLQNEAVELEFETIELRTNGFLIRDCAVALDLESMLLRDLGQNRFSTVSVISRHSGAVHLGPLYPHKQTSTDAMGMFEGHGGCGRLISALSAFQFPVPWKIFPDTSLEIPCSVAQGIRL
jgi:hypothetical protein